MSEPGSQKCLWAMNGGDREAPGFMWGVVLCAVGLFSGKGCGKGWVSEAQQEWLPLTLVLQRRGRRGMEGSRWRGGEATGAGSANSARGQFAWRTPCAQVAKWGSMALSLGKECLPYFIAVSILIMRNQFCLNRKGVTRKLPVPGIPEGLEDELGTRI